MASVMRFNVDAAAAQRGSSATARHRMDDFGHPAAMRAA